MRKKNLYRLQKSKVVKNYLAFCFSFMIPVDERISLMIDDIKISPKAIAPPIFIVVISPSTKAETSLFSADCIVLKIVNPGTVGINPGIKNTIAGAQKTYAASSE